VAPQLCLLLLELGQKWRGSWMNGSTEDTSRAADPIDAELERALFKRFWTWLGVVGSIVIAAVTTISVLVSQIVVYTARETAPNGARSWMEN
jgi:hypothetical protein